MLSNKKAGFTLVELAIVLLIISLLLGVIVSSIAFKRQADVRAIIKGFYNVNTAVSTFVTAYGFYPGDFSGASALWPSGTCAAGTAPGGCNGNGDGMIDTGNFNSGYEMFRAIQHLSLAGIIKGSYNGTIQYIPASYPNGFFSIRDGNDFGISSNYKIELGAYGAYAWGGPSAYCGCQGLLYVMDAKNVDKKIDDGVANTGKMLGVDGWNTSWNSCSDPTGAGGGADYNMASTVAGCRLQWNLE